MRERIGAASLSALIGLIATVSASATGTELCQRCNFAKGCSLLAAEVHVKTGADVAGEETFTTLHKGTVLACHQPTGASSPLCIPNWLTNKDSFCDAYLLITSPPASIIPLAEEDAVRVGRQLMDETDSQPVDVVNETDSQRVDVVNETDSQPVDVASVGGLPRPSGFGDDPVAAAKGGTHKGTCPPWRPCAYEKVLDKLQMNPVREAERIVEEWASSHKNARSLLTAEEEKKFDLWHRYFEKAGQRDNRLRADARELQSLVAPGPEQAPTDAPDTPPAPITPPPTTPPPTLPPQKTEFLQDCWGFIAGLFGFKREKGEKGGNTQPAPTPAPTPAATQAPVPTPASLPSGTEPPKRNNNFYSFGGGTLHFGGEPKPSTQPTAQAAAQPTPKPVATGFEIRTTPSPPPPPGSGGGNAEDTDPFKFTSLGSLLSFIRIKGRGTRELAEVEITPPAPTPIAAPTALADANATTGTVPSPPALRTASAYAADDFYDPPIPGSWEEAAEMRASESIELEHTGEDSFLAAPDAPSPGGSPDTDDAIGLPVIRAKKFATDWAHPRYAEDALPVKIDHHGDDKAWFLPVVKTSHLGRLSGVLSVVSR